ncbi:MAG: anti-sigma factor, partial [Acidimicrobiia bacterium]
VLVAAAVLALGFKVVDQDRQIERLTASLEKQAVAASAYETLTDPSAKTLALRSAKDGPEAQLVLASDGRGLLIANALPGLQVDETYQLWALVGEEKISSGLLGSQPNVSLFTFRGGRPDGFAVTKEPSGGSPQPTNDPIVLGVFR